MKDNTKYTPELAFMYVMDAIASNPTCFERVISNGEREHKFDGYHLTVRYISNTYWVSAPFKSGMALYARASMYKKDTLTSRSGFEGPSIKLVKYATGSIVDETILKHPVWYSIFGYRIKKSIITERIQNPEFAYRLKIGSMEFRLDEFMYKKLLNTHESAMKTVSPKVKISHDVVTDALDAFEKRQEQELV
jgi:hypothetical protein